MSMADLSLERFHKDGGVSARGGPLRHSDDVEDLLQPRHQLQRQLFPVAAETAVAERLLARRKINYDA